VSRRRTKRHLLFDNAMRLMGWLNMETGELRSPYDWVKNPDSAALDLENYRLTIMRGTTEIVLNLFAFSGVHSFSPCLFPLMDRFPDRFPIIDFYLQTCHRTRIYGCQKDDLRLLDVGKIDSLEKAEKFL
ncbi:MAG: nucleotidyltransferase family protein, partial [Prevotella sp.]|nr:nucleotidyltransferase family protein [Prevotella sp.]